MGISKTFPIGKRGVNGEPFEGHQRDKKRKKDEKYVEKKQYQDWVMRIALKAFS